ncbi:MAG: hypothetical protein JNN11_02525 [Candidatus Doudnabacteria bacterium]|nr:hypothetical protein [Candidatus Doudnabacteria bacterium]
MLNIRISATWGQRLTDLGINTEVRDSAAQLVKNLGYMNEAQKVGIDPLRLKRTDKAGNRQVDSGVQVRFTAQHGNLLSVARIGYDLMRRHNMTFTGCWMMRKEGSGPKRDRMFFLRLRFEAYRDGGAELFSFFEFYKKEIHLQYAAHPEDVPADMTPMTAAEADEQELKSILDVLLQRLYKHVILFKNPNRTWTINNGQALDADRDGTPARHNRLRLVDDFQWMLDDCEVPLKPESSIEPRKRPVRRVISQPATEDQNNQAAEA